MFATKRTLLGPCAALAIAAFGALTHGGGAASPSDASGDVHHGRTERVAQNDPCAAPPSGGGAPRLVE